MSDPIPPESTPEPTPPPVTPAPPIVPEPTVVEPAPPTAPVSVEVPPPVPGATIPPPPAGMSEANWAMFLHLTPLLALLVCCVIPGVSILGPLIIWLIKRPESPTLDAIGKRVLNFQISYTIYLVAAWILSLVLSAIHIGWLPGFAGIVIGVAWLVFTILGAIKQSKGEAYQPPFVLDLIK